MALLDARRTEMRKLTDALARRPYPEERAILAGSLLGAAGYLLRRSRVLAAAEGKSDGAADTALRGLAREDLNTWLASASTAGLRQAMQRATDAAFEAALSDDDSEREGHREAAMEGLAEREHLAATLDALRRWEALVGPLDDRPRRRRDALEAEARSIDEALRKGARALAALNDARRTERDLLDPDHRASAWWYTQRADCDDLAALLAGRSFESHHCDECRRDSRASRSVEQPPHRHLSEEELWAYDLGTISKEQRTWVHRHTASCQECKRTLRALSEGEEAIQEALGAAPRRAAPEPEQEVAFEHPRFRALVFRSAKKLRVVLEEKEPNALLSVTPATAGLKLRRMRTGFELQLPSSKADARITLRVTLAGHEELSVEIPLR